MKHQVICLFLGVLVQGFGQAASFDCMRAASKVERLICDSPKLSELDDQLGKAWNRHLRNNEFKDQFRKTQKRWIEQRNQCEDEDCLVQAYQARLGQMASDREYFLREGEGEPLCESFVRALNAELYRPARGRVCALEILKTLPGVQMPPWQKLDIYRDKDLYKRFILAGYVGEELWSAAFADPPPKAGQIIDSSSKRARLAMPSDDDLNKEWTWAVEHGFEFYRLNNAIPFPERGNVLLVAFVNSRMDCPTWSVELFSGDLKRPIPVSEYSYRKIPFQFKQSWFWLSALDSKDLISTNPEIHRFELPRPNLTAKPLYHEHMCQVDSMNKNIKPE